MSAAYESATRRILAASGISSRLQRIRIAGAVPPFVMPAHEQLRRAICSDSRRFAFANHRMTRKIESLFIARARRVA